MALIKCPECGNDVSTKATECPNCGCPLNEAAFSNENKTKKKLSVKKIIIAVVALIFIFFLLIEIFLTKDYDAPLDYSNVLGTSADDLDDIVMTEDSMSILFKEDGTLLSGRESVVYNDMNGETEYRCFDAEIKGLAPYDIYYVSWSTGSGNEEQELFDDNTRDTIIKQYDKLYGEHSDSSTQGDGRVEHKYRWKLKDKKIFEITVYSTMNYMCLTWKFE